MTIEVTYNVTDIYISSEVSPIYIDVNYQTSGSGAAVWGGITGTLSNQTDLQTALNGKFDDPTGTTSQYLRGDGSLATFPSLTGYVPYSGATSAVNLGEYGISAGQFTLDVSPTGTPVIGTTRWNDTLGSSETTLKGGSVILKNGVDLVARIVNKVSPNTTLTKAAYQAVRVSGAQGQRLAVAFAQANNDNNSADTIGLVIETIATNQEGFIMTVGQVEGINTTGLLQGETWADGDVLYLSPTVAGALTNIKPTGATGHIVIIGYVEYAHSNNGKIYVKVMNGWELDELHNVYISSVANNQGLFYESSSSLWKNKSISTVIGYTPEQPLTFNSPLSRSTNTVSIPAASSSANGYLSSTDWSTFNAKQNALTNPVTGTGTTNELAYFSGTSAISSLTTATYPSLTEFSYVKGVTSAVQTQLNAKQGTLTLTTTGTSGAATLVGSTLNIPSYTDTIVTNRQTSSYTLVLADRSKLVEMNVASANTLTVPLNSSVAFPTGTKIDVTQYGAGATTITATSGVTIRSYSGYLKLGSQYAACTLVKIATDEWYCYGNLIA
jgi:nitrogen fixation protein